MVSTVNVTTGKPYGKRKRAKINAMYTAAIILWILLIMFVFQPDNILEWLILLIPILVFLFGIATSGQMLSGREEKTLNISLLGIGLIVVLTFFGALSSHLKGLNDVLVYVMAAFVIFLIGALDFAVPERNISYLIHFRAITSTLAVTLLFYAVVAFLSKKRSLDTDGETPSIVQDV